MRDVTHMSEYEGRKLCVRLTRDPFVKINEGHDSYAADIGSIFLENLDSMYTRKKDRKTRKQALKRNPPGSYQYQKAFVHSTFAPSAKCLVCLIIQI